MPETINKSILQNYDTYKKVRYENKKITDNKIVLEKKRDKNNNFNYGNSPIRSNHVSDIELIIEAHKIDIFKYGFKLCSLSISERPFFRFDSSGGFHNNISPIIPLTLRQVSTPHFQFYDELGHNTAYKTDVLKDVDIIDELRENINKGIEIFCQESVIFTIENGMPFIERDTELLFKAQNIDPLIDENFNES